LTVVKEYNKGVYMPQVEKIKQIEGGFIVYTSKILLSHEQELIKAELKAISAVKLGHLFFRVN
jgi:hypothetical protein